MTMENMVTRPTEIVRNYCTRAEELIMTASSPIDAMSIKEEWCTQFRKECESDLLFNATSAYLDDIIWARWNRGLQ